MGGIRAGPAVRPVLRIGVEASLVPGVLQTLALLPFAHTDLEAAVDSALARNPTLERAPGHPCPGCGRHVLSHRCSSCGPVTGSQPEAEVAPLDTLRVLAACEVKRGLGRVLDVVVDHLTDRGLLDADTAEIAAANGFAQADVREALRAVKAVGPPGIAERSVPELLAVQADQLVQRGIAPPWMVPLIRHHLDLIGDDDTTRVAEMFDAEPSLVADVFALVRRHLRPAAVFDDDHAPAPAGTPDVYIRRDEEGGLRVEAPDSRWFGLRVAEVAPLVAADREARQFLSRHERDARILLAQLDARSDVLSQVVLWAVRWQREYLDRGPMAHRDLTRSAVAHQLGLHPSTVARAVNGKVARTPNGEFIQLGELFGTGVAIRAELAELLRHSHFSDAQLAEELAGRGHRVARRTVAKYRAQLGMRPPKLTS